MDINDCDSFGDWLMMSFKKADDDTAKWHALWAAKSLGSLSVNTLTPDGWHFADNILKGILFNENCYIFIKISLKYVRKGPIDTNLALVQIMAWGRTGDKPLSEPMMA